MEERDGGERWRRNMEERDGGERWWREMEERDGGDRKKDREREIEREEAI